MNYQKLCSVLHEEGVLSKIPSSDIFADCQEKPIRRLAMMGLIEEEKALQVLSRRVGMQLLNLDDPAQLARCTFANFQGRIDPEFLWKNTVIPLREDSSGVVVALANPFEHESLQQLKFMLDKSIQPVLASELQIVRLLTAHFSVHGFSFDRLDSIEQNEYVEVLSSKREEEERVDNVGPDTPPIVKLCNRVISDAIAATASDIHLDPTQDSLSVRLRIDGVMHSVLEIPKRLQSYVVARFKVLASMDISEKRRPQDGRIRVRVSGKPVDMRVSTVPTPYGEKVVLRILHADVSQLTFTALGTPEYIQRILSRALDKRGRMILVTGPTGSGKTTTLYSCLNYLRDGSLNIITVEDPIEYRIPGINQIQVNEQIGVTFASSLRSVLRQDPDVIMVGEIRDADTARIGLQAAQTGHLVFSTLHANDSIAAISRLAGLGAEPYLISAGLEGVIAQRLVRKNCSHCLSDVDQQYFERHQEIADHFSITQNQLKVGKGCQECRFTGFRGQTALFSYLEITPTIAELIVCGATASVIREQALREGFIPLESAAASLVSSGVLALHEAKSFLLSGVSEAQQQTQKESAAPTVSSVSQHGETEVSQANVSLSSPQHPRIMIVEDDADLREVLSMLLKREQYDVQQAANGREALDKLYEFAPHVVLCDLMMPDVDGKQFLAKIRSNPQTRKIPVIMLTAVDSEDNEISLLDLGANDFVSKTASSNVMLGRIRSVLSRTS